MEKYVFLDLSSSCFSRLWTKLFAISVGHHFHIPVFTHCKYPFFYQSTSCLLTKKSFLESQGCLKLPLARDTLMKISISFWWFLSNLNLSNFTLIFSYFSQRNHTVKIFNLIWAIWVSVAESAVNSVPV